MLQRRAQEATRKYVAQKKARGKLFYTTVAPPAEQRPYNGTNAFISTDVSNPRLEFPEYLTPEDSYMLRPFLAIFRVFVKLLLIPRTDTYQNYKMQPHLQNVAVKDNIATVGSRTTCGSGILGEYQSPFEAGVVRSLRLQGSLVCGKTNMDEFGMGSHSTNSFFGPVTNVPPFDRLSVGGSSGGSAAAIASGQTSIALGTDTGGSVRLPAAYTGIVGFKPSYGAISRWGVIPYANSLDTVGIMASDVKSIKEAFWRIRQHDPRDPTSLSRKAFQRLAVDSQTLYRKKRAGKRSASALNMLGIRIGVPLEYNIVELDPGVRQAWRNCLDMFQDQGATIVSVSLPNTRHALSAYYILAPAEAASNLAKYDGVRYGTRDGSVDGSHGGLYSTTRGSGFGDEVKRRILLGSYTLSSEAVDNYFLKAQKVRRLVQRDFDRVFATSSGLRPPEQFDLKDLDESIPMSSKLGPTQVDFIVCPTAPTLPPTLDDVSKQKPVHTYMNDVFTVPASLAGIPAISIPFPLPEAFHSEDKPAFVGMQIIGQYASDSTVISVANVITTVMRDSKQYPQMECVADNQKFSTLETNPFVFKGGQNPVLEEGGLPIRKVVHRKVVHKAKLIRTVGIECGENPTSQDEASKQPIPKIRNLYAIDPIAADDGRDIPIQKTATEKGYVQEQVLDKKKDLAPDRGVGVPRIQRFATRPPLIRKYLRKFDNVKPRLESEQIQPSIRYHITYKGDVERFPKTDNEVSKVRPSIRYHLSNKEFVERFPKTGNEVSKVLEDSLGLWKRQHS